MANLKEEIFAKPIQLCNSVIKEADKARSFKKECGELKSRTDKLAALLRQAAKASSELYERPTRRIIHDTQQVLEKTLSLVRKCRATGRMGSVFTIISVSAFSKMASQLENSIADFSWLFRVLYSVDAEDDEYFSFPPIAANEPELFLIWGQIATLSTGSMDARCDAASSLASLARDNEGFGKLIIEEGGVLPLLKLLKEGKMKGQEHAARAIGLLGMYKQSLEPMIDGNVFSVFAQILEEGPMKVQAVVAWAASVLVATFPGFQNLFAQHNIIRFLVGHLAFETVQEHSKYAITSHKSTSIHAVDIASSSSANTMAANNVPKGRHGVTNRAGMGSNGKQNELHHHHHHHQQQHNHSIPGVNLKGRELEDPDTKAEMKAMAAKALWQLAKGNSAICRCITESRALLCFAVLLEKGNEEVRYYSAMALMEIAAVAENDAALRRSAFKPNSPACKAVIDQLLRIIGEADSVLHVPCIKAIGSLARIFRASETIIICQLVKLLDETEANVLKETVIALTKFACTENYLHLHHSETIIEAGGARHLIQIVYFGEQIAQSLALRLLCYIAMHLPDRDELAAAEVLAVLKWASKQSSLCQDEQLELLLPDAKCRLELYQSRTCH